MTTERPHVILNMVMSIDGRTTLGGKVGDLTGPADQERVYRLRAQADAVLVGAGTVRNERYGNVLPGRPEQPLVVIVSASGALPPDLPLLAEPQTRIVLATASAAELEFEHAARLDYLHLPAPGGGVDLPALLRTLRDQFGVRSVVCEGGPTLNDGLIAAGLIDELYLTLSPKLVDGGERALIDSSQPYAQIDARLMDVDSVDDFVFLRYEL